MEWRAEGILLATTRLGENGVIVDTFTAEHGRHSGLVRGGSGRRYASTLQPGNQVFLAWRGRLADQLGRFEVELIESRAAGFLDNRESLAMFNALRALLIAFVPEHEALPHLYARTLETLEALPDPQRARDAYARWELSLLQEIGFALDLEECAATGTRQDLCYVSPRSGRAVSRSAGAPYIEKLLPLPAFLIADQAPATRSDLSQAMRLTGFFLKHRAAAMLDRAELPDAWLRLHDMMTGDP